MSINPRKWKYSNICIISSFLDIIYKFSRGLGFGLLVSIRVRGIVVVEISVFHAHTPAHPDTDRCIGWTGSKAVRQECSGTFLIECAPISDAFKPLNRRMSWMRGAKRK